MNRTESFEKTGQKMTRKGEDFVDRATEKARETAEAVGERLSGASEAIQGKLRETGEEAGEVVNTVSEKIRSSVHYLEESNMQEVIDDVTVLIKRYPIQAVLIGAGIGFLLARVRSR
jgi:ElaB/YqjD/DUF883 family membrane-anchored ribosome-binding protein